MNKLKQLAIIWFFAVLWSTTQVTAKKIADVLEETKKTENVLNFSNNTVNDSINFAIDQNLNIKNPEKSESDDKSTDKKENKKFKFEGSFEFQSLLYDNFTFERYSKNPWIHFLGSATFPIGKKLSLSLSESLYYTQEKENNVTDLILSWKLSDKFSADVWLEYSYYLKQKDADMLSIFLMLNYSSNDRVAITSVPYKPLLLDWKKISDFYLLNKFTYKTLSNVEFWVNTVTSCTDDWKTKVWFTLTSPIWDNLSLGFSTIPKESESWTVSILPEWIQWIVTYSF